MVALDVADLVARLHDPSSVEARLGLPVAAALATHAVCQFYEPNARLAVPLLAVSVPALAFAAAHAWSLPARAALHAALAALGVWLVALTASIVTYRLFFHRLCRFPGPWYLAASKWCNVPTDAVGARPQRYAELHRRYGEVVRVGPRELSINSAAAIPTIYGAQANVTRGPFYAFNRESTPFDEDSVQTVPTMAQHAARRKVWDRAFSQKATSEYVENLVRLVEECISGMEDAARRGAAGKSGGGTSDGGGIVDVGEWCKFLGFDAMGELAFSRSFGLMRKGALTDIITTLEQGVKLIMALSNVPYVPSLVRDLPSPTTLLVKHVIGVVEARIASIAAARQQQGKAERHEKVLERDVFAHFLGELDDDPSAAGAARGWPLGQLVVEGGLLVVAGSDTSSNTMGLVLYYLVRYQEYLARVRDELESVFSGELAQDLDRLAKRCPVLNACIQETLRMHAPVASGLQRVTPREGLALPDGTVVPPDTVVSVPTQVVQRDARNFSRPDEWRPSRWLEPKSEPVHNARAFNAFSFGPTSCIGKSVAMMELRLIVARFVQCFDAEFAPGFDAEDYPRHIRDYFVMGKPPVPMVLHRRKDAL